MAWKASSFSTASSWWVAIAYKEGSRKVDLTWSILRQWMAFKSLSFVLDSVLLLSFFFIFVFLAAETKISWVHESVEK